MEPVREAEAAEHDHLPFEGLVAAAMDDQRGATPPDTILSEITHLLVSEASPDRVLEAVADALRQVAPYDTLTLYRADPPLRMLRPALARDTYAEEVLNAGPLPYGEGITGHVAETGTPLLVPDAHLDPRGQQIEGTPNEPECLLAIPLLARDELKGVLCLYRLGEGNVFSAEEFHLVIRFGDLAAMAIDNAQIRARLETEVVTDHLTALYNHRYFHERLAEEMRRSHRNRSHVGLLIYDIDDFKRVNDGHGHLVGDQVLQGVASLSREICRSEDVICRIGGEEFAIILPGGGVREAAGLAERIRAAMEDMAFPVMDAVTVSIGVAEGPRHAASPRELMACADVAMLRAKAEGKNRVHVFSPGGDDADEVPWIPEADRPRNGNGTGNGNGIPTGKIDRGGGGGASGRMGTVAAQAELRSVAQLRTLQSLSAKLNRLNDVRQIGELITTELRTLIDYHNSRVYVIEADGETLMPIAFQGTLSEYQGETFDALLMKVGEGLTGRVAETGQSYYTPNANVDEFAVNIPGTPDLDESILAVPMRYGDRVIGVVVLSKLGVDQFDDEDLRLLDALASAAAVAVENARLLQAERETAQVSTALLRLSQALTTASDMDEILDQALAAIPTMLGCSQVQAYIQDEAGFRLIRHRGFEERHAERLTSRVIPSRTALRFGGSREYPFVVAKEALSDLPEEYLVVDELKDVLVAPIRWDPDGLGAILILAPDPTAGFSSRDLALARGITDITSLALGSAARFVELEQAYLSTVEALANAVEAKDEYTGDHCRALAEMSMAVGAEMGLTADRMKVLELGALFHDIGKIGVASDIIRKPGPLSAAERRAMNLHPDIGEQILSPVPFLQRVRPIIRASHERWDGNGYPEGLAAEQIPLESRIVFVCDAYHAMTTDRPYRAALPEGEAIRRLKLAAGTQFDPEVVATFVGLHRSGRIQYRHRH